MARKKVSRTLSRLPSSSGLGASDHRTDRLLEILRSVAVKNQKEQPQPFYAVRDVAKQFRVPLSTVSQIYQHLESEGLLSRVRSSKTILHGLHYNRRLSVRAFVGIPASLSAFVTIQDYRMFFIRIRRELRLRGFATAMPFFEPEELRNSALSDRLKKYEVDTVIWFQPPRTAKETVLRLADTGIRILGVCEEESSLPCRYHIQREPAIRRLFNEWKTRFNATKVVLIESHEHRTVTNDVLVEYILDDLQIDRVVILFKGERSERFLRDLQKMKVDGVIFSSSALASMFSFRHPDGMTDLLKSHRVAFVGGPINMPFARVPKACIDLITVNWQLVAKAIVDDLISQEAFTRSGPTVFEAEAYSRVPLNHFAQNI